MFIVLYFMFLVGFISLVGSENEKVTTIYNGMTSVLSQGHSLYFDYWNGGGGSGAYIIRKGHRVVSQPTASGSVIEAISLPIGEQRGELVESLLRLYPSNIMVDYAFPSELREKTIFSVACIDDTDSLSDGLIACGLDGKVMIFKEVSISNNWNKKLAQVMEKSHETGNFCLALARKDNSLMGVLNSGTIKQWDLQKEKDETCVMDLSLFCSDEESVAVESAKIHQDNQLIIAVLKNKKVMVYDIQKNLKCFVTIPNQNFDFSVGKIDYFDQKIAIALMETNYRKHKEKTENPSNSRVSTNNGSQNIVIALFDQEGKDLGSVQSLSCDYGWDFLLLPYNKIICAHVKKWTGGWYKSKESLYNIAWWGTPQYDFKTYAIGKDCVPDTVLYGPDNDHLSFQGCAIGGVLFLCDKERMRHTLLPEFRNSGLPISQFTGGDRSCIIPLKGIVSFDNNMKIEDQKKIKQEWSWEQVKKEWRSYSCLKFLWSGTGCFAQARSLVIKGLVLGVIVKMYFSMPTMRLVFT